MIAKRPDRNTAGSISPVRPQRNATVKIAKPKADPSAAKLPLIATLPDLSATMTAIPAIAMTIAIQVARRTRSRRITHPSTAAINGAVANKSMAFATEVFWME